MKLVIHAGVENFPFRKQTEDGKSKQFHNKTQTNQLQCILRREKNNTSYEEKFL